MFKNRLKTALQPLLYFYNLIEFGFIKIGSIKINKEFKNYLILLIFIVAPTFAIYHIIVIVMCTIILIQAYYVYRLGLCVRFYNCPDWLVFEKSDKGVQLLLKLTGIFDTLDNSVRHYNNLLISLDKNNLINLICYDRIPTFVFILVTVVYWSITINVFIVQKVIYVYGRLLSPDLFKPYDSYFNKILKCSIQLFLKVITRCAKLIIYTTITFFVVYYTVLTFKWFILNHLANIAFSTWLSIWTALLYIGIEVTRSFGAWVAVSLIEALEPSSNFIEKLDNFLIFMEDILEDVLRFLLNLDDVWDWEMTSSNQLSRISLIFYNVPSVTTYLLVTLLYVLVGGTIPLLERKYLSLIQRRVGPKFVGYNGRLQILADALKLLFKELIVLKSTNSFLFLTLPLIILSVNLLMCGTIVWYGSIYMFDSNHTIFLILIVELLTTILTTYIGIITKNKYTLIASVRIINGVIVFEIFLTSVLSYFYLTYDSTGFIGSFNDVLVFTKLTYFITVVCVITNFILLLLKKVPFDIIEAETELIMGYTSEHSGFLSGSLILVEYLHLLFWAYFLNNLFVL